MKDTKAPPNAAHDGASSEGDGNAESKAREDGEDKEKDGSEKVGYGRPPKASQFPKGASGNPGGKPRRQAPDVDDCFKKVAAREVRPGTSLLDLVVESVGFRAAKGDRHATTIFLKNVRQGQRREIARVESTEDDRETLKDWLPPEHFAFGEKPKSDLPGPKPNPDDDEDGQHDDDPEDPEP